MATTKKANDRWARLRHVAVEEPKEADAALAEVADALGTMADALSNLRENMDLVSPPKNASLRIRIAAARKYATRFRIMAEEAPEVVADAISQVYHSLDDVAGAMENLAESMGIELSLTPAEAAFDEEGKEEVAEGKEPGDAPVEVDDNKFEEAEEELDSPEGEEAEAEFEKEAGFKAAKSPQPDSRKCEECKTSQYKKTVNGRKLCRDCAEDATERKAAGSKAADGSAGFVNDRDENAKPEAPKKLEIPQAQGESEVNKAASRRLSIRNRIAKRYGIKLD